MATQEKKLRKRRKQNRDHEAMSRTDGPDASDALPAPRGSKWTVATLPEEAFGMAAIGCSNSEIADLYRINRAHFQEQLNEQPEVANRLREARAKGTRSVTKALWNRATGQQYTDKHGNFLAPDIGAIKFWLCNRNREQWKSEAKLEVQHSGEIRDGRTNAVALVEDLTDEQLVDYLAEIGVAVAKKRPEIESAIEQAKKERVN